MSSALLLGFGGTLVTSSETHESSPSSLSDVVSNSEDVLAITIFVFCLAFAAAAAPEGGASSALAVEIAAFRCSLPPFARAPCDFITGGLEPVGEAGSMLKATFDLSPG
jgi:hypothetical protein